MADEASAAKREFLETLHRTLEMMTDAMRVVVAGISRDGVLLSTDTAMALGKTIGVIGQAKALVGRDIDDIATAGGQNDNRADADAAEP